MDKKYIEEILMNENMVHTVATKRTYFSHIMSEFYFFKIFFESLKTVGITVILHNEVLPFSDVNTSEKIEIQKSIEFIKGLDTLKVQIDQYKLQDDIDTYNLLQGDMGFNESARMLIDIFISLL